MRDGFEYYYIETEMREKERTHL